MGKNRYFTERTVEMANWLMPDRVFESFDGITAQFLLSNGIRALIIDIDNTLAPYEVERPDERVSDWFSELERNGIKATLMSNNDRQRVEIFNETLQLPYYYKSGKPFAKNLKLAMKNMGSDPSNTAVIGDQLLTDAAAGKHIGLRAFIVPPINDKSSAFFRMKRALEVPTIKQYVKQHANGADMDTERCCSFWLEGKYKKKRG